MTFWFKAARGTPLFALFVSPCPGLTGCSGLHWTMAKRPAASTAGSGAAKKAKGPAIGKMCKDIASALKSSSYPKHVIE
eukprot:s12367_g1.t1